MSLPEYSYTQASSAPSFSAPSFPINGYATPDPVVKSYAQEYVEALDGAIQTELGNISTGFLNLAGALDLKADASAIGDGLTSADVDTQIANYDYTTILANYDTSAEVDSKIADFVPSSRADDIEGALVQVWEAVFPGTTYPN